jgi:hypothetical protein
MTGSNFWVNSFPASVPGGAAYGAGGYGTDALTARDGLDAKRLANGFAPGASYPDGYLGNITDRQQDKLMTALQSKLSQRSYVRGVHVGEKVGTGSYFWDDQMNPDMGLERQAQAVPVDVEGGIVMMTPRFAPTGDPVEYLAHDGKTAGLLDREAENRARAAGVDPTKNPPLTYSNPARADRIRANMPRWR